MSSTITETATTGGRRGPRGPRHIYTIDDSNGLIIDKFKENTTHYPVNELTPVQGDLTYEMAIISLRNGFSWEDICKGKSVPSRIAVSKPEKVAKAAKAPSAVVQAVAQVNGTDIGAAAALFAALSKEKKALIRKDPAVVYAVAQIKGRVRSLNELIAAPDASEAELEQAAD